MAWQHYVAIGDSLTAGTGDPFDGIEHLSWADRFAQALAPLHPGFQYQNLAQRGKTTAQMIAEQLPEALSLRPDLVSILGGGNDLYDPNWTPQAYRKNLLALVEPFLAIQATVVVVAMIDNFESRPVAVQEQMRGLYLGVRAINRVVREVCREHNLLLIDLERVSDLHGMEMISSDGIHANSLGYVKIAAEVARQFSAQTGVALDHPALRVPEWLPEKHRVFREMLSQMEHPS